MVGIGKAYFHITFSMVSGRSEGVIWRCGGGEDGEDGEEHRRSKGGGGASLRGTKQSLLKLTKGRLISKDCFVVPPRNDGGSTKKSFLKSQKASSFKL